MFQTVRRSTAARGRSAHGWTQAELLVAMAISGMLLTLALPHYRTWLSAYELRNAAEQLAAGMAVARSEAIKRGHRVNLCKSADRRRCADSGGWDAGWVLYADLNVDGRVDDDEPLLRSDGPVRPGIRVVANRPLDDYVSYTSLGHARLLDGALQMGSFRVCRAGQAAWKVVLANSGRVRVERTGEPCA
jgi:type IV fimbrial biogenesis protein FimT